MSSDRSSSPGVMASSVEVPPVALQDMFWGGSFGMLTDQFGVNWMFNFEKR